MNTCSRNNRQLHRLSVEISDRYINLIMLPHLIPRLGSCLSP